MMELDSDLPESGPLGWLARRLNKINAHLRSLRPASSIDMKTDHTAIGVVRRPKATNVEEGAPSGDEPIWL